VGRHVVSNRPVVETRSENGDTGTGSSWQKFRWVEDKLTLACSLTPWRRRERICGYAARAVVQQRKSSAMSLFSSGCVQDVKVSEGYTGDFELQGEYASLSPLQLSSLYG